MNRAADGYLMLRQTGRHDASKHLVRPTLEAMFRLQCINADEHSLFGIIKNEIDEHRKWARSALKDDDQLVALKALEKHEADFRRNFADAFPGYVVPPRYEAGLSAWDSADIAKLTPYYESHYRLYCQFTHASFNATAGGLEGFARTDNHGMVLSVLVCLKALSDMGVPGPRNEIYWHEFNRIYSAPNFTASAAN